MDSIGCTLALLGLASIPFLYVLSGWALSVLWGWFIVPTFDAPVLSVPVAIGVATVISYLTDHRSSPSNQGTKSKTEAQVDLLVTFFYGVFRPLLALLVGWIVLQFV